MASKIKHVSNLNETDLYVAEGIAAGKTQTEIAKELGVYSTSVNHRIARKPALKELIKKIQENILDEGITQAKDNIIHAITNYKKPQILEIEEGENKKKVFDWQLREHGFKASLKVLESAGVVSGTGMSVQINNIYNDNRQEIPEVITEWLKGKLDDTLDAEYKEIGE